jgi:hypothetical protein
MCLQFGGAPTHLTDVVAPTVDVASKQQSKYSSTFVDSILEKQMSRPTTFFESSFGELSSPRMWRLLFSA